MSEEKKNLYQKIQNVSNDIKNLEKDMTVGKGMSAYKAVSDLTVVLAVKKAETKWNIISIPMKQELIDSKEIRTLKKDDYGEREVITYSFLVKMTTRIQDLESEDYLEIESFGHGLDNGDKGFGKAATYARKYALLNAYKIATGEDPDAAKPANTEVAKENQQRILVENYLLKNNSVRADTFTHFGIGELSDFSDEQIKSMYNSLSAKGKL